ncbi:MAG: hypothetical protein EOP06_06605, partial [Proteobacteria bacterium]
VLGLSKILALLSAAVIARYFDRETSGIVFFVTGIVSLSISITTLGLAASSSYYYSRNLRRGRHARNWQVFHLALLIAILPSAIIAFLALSMEEARDELSMLIVPILAVSCFMAAIRQISKMFFTIENRRDWSLIHDSVTYNFLIILTIVGWSFLQGGGQLGAVTGLIAILIASSLAGAFAIWHTIRMLTADRGPFEVNRIPSRRYTIALMAISLPSMVAQGSALILNKIDVLLIGPLAGAVEVGTYSVAIRMTFLSGVLTEVIALFLAPKIIAIGASGNRNKQWEILKLATKLQFAALLITTIPIIVFHKQIITLIFGAGYIDVSTTYLIMQAGKTLTAIFSPVIALFTALGFNREMAKVAVIVAIINVGLNLWLIPLYGATGAAISGTIALVIMFGNYIRLTFEIRRRARMAK